MRLIIIGGSDAGISAALRAREINPRAAITLVCRDYFPNFSICGLPFFISGEVKDWRTLAHRTIEEIEEKGIRLLLGHKVEAIHSASKTISIKDPDKNSIFLSFDKLVICTGAVSVKPKINRIELPGVFPLRWMDDSFALKRFLDEKQPTSAVVVGGGYIGMEMADAFRHRGMKVTIVEYADTVLTTFDPDLGIKIEEHLRTNGVEVRTRTPVSAIEKECGSLLIKGGDGLEVQSDIVLFAVGVRPDVDLALSAGLEIGEHGAIRVNRKMETSMPGIYAAGDCVETWHRLLEKNVYMPLGTTAQKQGVVAGENAAGCDRKFQGSLGDPGSENL